MSWISWTTSLVPTLLVVLASLAWWHTEPKTLLVNLIALGGAVVICFTVAPALTHDLSLSAYTSYARAVAALSLDSFVLRHANMLVTGGAVVWYVAAPTRQVHISCRPPKIAPRGCVACRFPKHSADCCISIGW